MMPTVSRAPSFARWGRLADAITLALLAFAAVIMVTGGVRTRVFGVMVSFTAAWRPALCAVVIAALRHAIFRDDSLWQQVKRRLLSPGDVCLDEHGSTPLTALELSGVTALMAVLTLVMTGPQALRMDAVRDLGDPLFSIWRLAWIAHQLPRDPLNLFDGNIYYPSRFTLAYSDSIVLPGVVTAPLFWAGVPAVPLYNAFVLASFVLAGVSMYVLVRSLTGQPTAALVSGVVFAFYPFRFQHYNHLELLLPFWMPLALLAVHRTLARGRLRDGLMTGGAIAAQTLSCVYFGMFFAAYVVPVLAALAIGGRRIGRAVKPLAVGALVAAALLVPLLSPYLQVRQQLGERTPGQVEHYSLRPHDYLVAGASNAAWGNLLGRGAHGPEDAFPGIMVVALALVALWPPLSVPRIAYGLGLLFAFDMSLGSNGYFFPILYRALVPFRGLRAPGRMSMLVGLSLSVLGGYGVARLSAYLHRPSLRYLLAAALSTIVLLESRTMLSLEHVAPPHAVYHWFEGRPPGVLAELPAEDWLDAQYTYLSTVHWQRIVNGYSGVAPPSYEAFRSSMTTFPDDSSIRLLRSREVDYVVLHEEYYGRPAFRRVIEALDRRADLRECARGVTDGHEARIYQVIK
jgi:hypothetical protein